MVCQLMLRIRRRPSIIEFDVQGNQIIQPEMNNVYTFMVGDLGEEVDVDLHFDKPSRCNATCDIELDTVTTSSPSPA